MCGRRARRSSLCFWVSISNHIYRHIYIYIFTYTDIDLYVNVLHLHILPPSQICKNNLKLNRKIKIVQFFNKNNLCRYEEPWESEVGKIADVRVRPGIITEAGSMEILEIDFTKGRLGGSIATPTGFSGGLVARADGLWIGVITGHMMQGHPSLIDFSSAYSVYSFLDEL